MVWMYVHVPPATRRRAWDVMDVVGAFNHRGTKQCWSAISGWIASRNNDLDRTHPCWRFVGTWQVALLVARPTERMDKRLAAATKYGSPSSEDAGQRLVFIGQRIGLQRLLLGLDSVWQEDWI